MLGSVANPGCLSRILILPILNPGSRIPDPGSKKSNKREGGKKIWCHTFLCSNKFHKIVHYFSFKVLKKKIWANFQRIIELFTQKIVTKLSKVWGLGSGIRKKPIPDPGSRGQKGTGSRIPNRMFLGSQIRFNYSEVRIRIRLRDPSLFSLRCWADWNNACKIKF